MPQVMMNFTPEEFGRMFKVANLLGYAGDGDQDSVTAYCLDMVRQSVISDHRMAAIEEWKNWLVTRGASDMVDNIQDMMAKLRDAVQGKPEQSIDHPENYPDDAV